MTTKSTIQLPTEADSIFTSPTVVRFLPLKKFATHCPHPTTPPLTTNALTTDLVLNPPLTVDLAMVVAVDRDMSTSLSSNRSKKSTEELVVDMEEGDDHSRGMVVKKKRSHLGMRRRSQRGGLTKARRRRFDMDMEGRVSIGGMRSLSMVVGIGEVRSMFMEGEKRVVEGTEDRRKVRRGMVVEMRRKGTVNPNTKMKALTKRSSIGTITDARDTIKASELFFTVAA